jgi:hypothetical protein
MAYKFMKHLLTIIDTTLKFSALQQESVSMITITTTNSFTYDGDDEVYFVLLISLKIVS